MARVGERHARSGVLLYGAAPPTIARRGLDTGQRCAESSIPQGRKYPVALMSPSESHNIGYGWFIWGGIRRVLLAREGQ